MSGNMNWKQLNSYACPKCNEAYLEERTYNLGHGCTSPDCDFFITDIRFQEILKDMNKPKYEEPDRSDWV